MTPSILTTAKLLREAGIAVIPTKPDKRPLVEWRKYMSEIPTEAELSKWFGTGTAGMALVAGKVQCMDFDEKYSAGIFARFAKRSEEVGLDILIGELIRQKTPSGGYHLVWRCEEKPIRNLKLAEKANHEVLIETRGEGGYFLIAPSAGYALEVGDWSSIPVITEEDRDALLELAKSFDERPPSEPAEPAASPEHDVTPGDDYDFRADIPGLLKSHGWKSAGGKYWTRPGKARGISASWDVVPGRLFVFSSSTAFEPQHVYRPWHVYAILECGGDFKRAASELRRQGFGSAPKKKASAAASVPWDEPPGVEAPFEPPAVEGIDPHGNAPTNETEDDKIRRMLRARAFDESEEPPELVPLFTLAGVVICTPGNLAAVTAQAKVGKSAFVAALMATAMASPETDADTLSTVGYNAAGKAFVYFDTEQSKYHFWHAVNQAKRRAKVPQKPDWLSAHRVADLPAKTIRKAISIHMADVAEVYSGIYAVILDGVADLVNDVNDAEECNGFVAELHALAIRYDCCIICVIHKNPGGDKVRGHLGSQIERKAETNLTLDKEDEVTVVWSNKQRGATIDKKNAPRFRWDDELKMHVSVDPRNVVQPETMKVVQLHDMAVEAYNGEKKMRYIDLIKALVKSRDMSEPTAKRKVAEMRKHGVLDADSFGFLNLKDTEIVQ